MKHLLIILISILLIGCVKNQNSSEFVQGTEFLYQYDSFGVELYPFIVINYSGRPVANEKEKIIWVDLEDLDKVKIIPGSMPILQVLANEINIKRS